jgi:cytochrome c oxidase subunit 4
MSDASLNTNAVDSRHGTSAKEPDELRTYWKVFYWLMGLLVLTVIAGRIDLDRLVPGLNVAIALIIAAVKGTLVVLFFMHVRKASKLTWIFASAAFVWLIIMIGLSFNDYLLREDVKPTPRLTPNEFRAQTQEHERAGVQNPVAPLEH